MKFWLKIRNWLKKKKKKKQTSALGHEAAIGPKVDEFSIFLRHYSSTEFFPQGVRKSIDGPESEKNCLKLPKKQIKWKKIA